jgi:RNA-directed DNA polymerase
MFTCTGLIGHGMSRTGFSSVSRMISSHCAGHAARLARLTALLAELGLEPKLAKTSVVHLEVGGKGLDFLGFHHRMVKSPGRQGKRPVVFLARWPADKAMRHARDRIRHLTDRRRQLRPETIAEELNLFLRGWAAYFRYGHSARRFSKIRTYAWDPAGALHQ